MVWALVVAVVLLLLIGWSNLTLQKQVRHLQEEITDLRAGQDLSERVSYLVHKGREIEAIAMYRSATASACSRARTPSRSSPRTTPSSDVPLAPLPPASERVKPRQVILLVTRSSPAIYVHP